MNATIIISVVRDFAMYEHCIKNNQNVNGCELVPIDNRELNESIGILYNRFLDSRPRDENVWYVFCHEDFEPLENLSAALHSLDQRSIWGPIGASTKVIFGLYHKWQLVGSITECAKDGSNRHTIGTPVETGTSVETFDCQCLIVHSSLVQAYHLRFDEHLTFDLYTEDFCISAHERAGIVSRVLPISACHWSSGTVLPRYLEQEAYINKKYPDACYTGTSSLVLGGNPPFGRKITVLAKEISKLIRIKVIRWKTQKL